MPGCPYCCAPKYSAPTVVLQMQCTWFRMPLETVKKQTEKSSWVTLQLKLNRPRRPRNVVGRVFYRLLKALWIVSNTNQLFYSVVIYFIMVAFGPWGLGYFLDDGLGVVFAWGMIVNGKAALTLYSSSIQFSVIYWSGKFKEVD